MSASNTWYRRDDILTMQTSGNNVSVQRGVNLIIIDDSLSSINVAVTKTVPPSLFRK